VKTRQKPRVSALKGLNFPLDVLQGGTPAPYPRTDSLKNAGVGVPRWLNFLTRVFQATDPVNLTGKSGINRFLGSKSPYDISKSRDDDPTPPPSGINVFVWALYIDFSAAILPGARQAGALTHSHKAVNHAGQAHSQYCSRSGHPRRQARVGARAGLHATAQRQSGHLYTRPAHGTRACCGPPASAGVFTPAPGRGGVDGSRFQLNLSAGPSGQGSREGSPRRITADVSPSAMARGVLQAGVKRFSGCGPVIRSGCGRRAGGRGTVTVRAASKSLTFIKLVPAPRVVSGSRRLFLSDFSADSNLCSPSGDVSGRSRSGSRDDLTQFPIAFILSRPYGRSQRMEISSQNPCIASRDKSADSAASRDLRIGRFAIRPTSGRSPCSASRPLYLPAAACKAHLACRVCAALPPGGAALLYRRRGSGKAWQGLRPVKQRAINAGARNTARHIYKGGTQCQQ
jgi:hypothetical protein